jgi:serine protease Do
MSKAAPDTPPGGAAAMLDPIICRPRSFLRTYPSLYGAAVKSGLRLSFVAAVGLLLPTAALAESGDEVQQAAPLPAAPAPAKKAPDAKPADKGADAAKKELSADERALRGVVVLERAGQPLALGAVLQGDGRILSALSPLGSGNDLEARYANGSTARVKIGHHDRTWDLALLVPQSGKWSEGLTASSREPVRQDATLRAFTLGKNNKIAVAPIILRSHRTLLGGDDRQLDNAIEIGSRVSPLDLGSPVIDEEGRAVAVLGRGCAPNENRPCTPVAFGAPIAPIKNFLRTVPATAVPPAAWLGIQGVSETSGVVKGVRVLVVHPESPADEAHLKGGDKPAGDVILAVDGVPVTTPEALAEAIRSHGIGEKVPLTLFSQGKYRQVTVLLRAAPEARPATPPPANPAELPPSDAPPAPPPAPARKSRP